MPLASDTTLGVCYIDPTVFKANAAVYGAAAAIAPLSDDEIKMLVALASREIDNYCGRTFTPDTITENHKFDPATRRVSPNNPPVIELLSFQVQIAPQVYSNFDISNVLINNQENYLELASLAAIASQQLTSQVIALGISQPQVIIQYLSYQSIPESVAGATAITAAYKANEAFANSAITPGVGLLKSREQEVRRDPSYKPSDGIPQAAKDLLRGVSRIVAG
ncbi:MAG TPA: hypothetical protein VFC63_09815 [Blastocatellia bacterium]|nr:hypothetical protein [Blastocatellia bacterium]